MTMYSFSYLGKRTKPILSLDADLITDLEFGYRGGKEHYCESILGYPEGVLTVVYKRQGETDFQSFPSVKYTEDRTQIDSCTTKHTLKFGLNVTGADDEAEVKCVLTHTSSELESEVQSLELIPRKYQTIQINAVAKI